MRNLSGFRSGSSLSDRVMRWRVAEAGEATPFLLSSLLGLLNHVAFGPDTLWIIERHFLSRWYWEPDTTALPPQNYGKFYC